MVYIDLNMVRAGVVSHPSEWPYCGYNEIQDPRQRYSLIDHEGLMGLFGIKNRDELKKTYGDWLREGMERHSRERQPRWTESIAVGSESFVRDTQEKLGIRGIGREVVGTNECFELREPETPYEALLGPQNGDLRQENTYYWGKSVRRSTT
jgi:hypothetical protein